MCNLYTFCYHVYCICISLSIDFYLHLFLIPFFKLNFEIFSVDFERCLLCLSLSLSLYLYLSLSFSTYYNYHQEFYWRFPWGVSLYGGQQELRPEGQAAEHPDPVVPASHRQPAQQLGRTIRQVGTACAQICRKG